MYDYKFRHDDFALGKPKRHGLRRLLVRTAALVIAGAAFYGAFQLETFWTPSKEDGGAQSDIIPLALPPQSASPQDAQPTEHPTGDPTTSSANPAFSRLMASARETAATKSATARG
jgi:hypothetical protein